MSEVAQTPLVAIRPHRIRIIAWVIAPILVIAFASAGIFMQRTYTGAYFRISDQIAMVLVGLLLAAGVLVLTRPRVLVDADGIDIRGFFARKKLPWNEVLGVSFPDKAYFARIELAYDEYYPVMAIQVWDGHRAVTALQALRAAQEHAKVG